jgi:hypothetical protein
MVMKVIIPIFAIFIIYFLVDYLLNLWVFHMEKPLITKLWIATISSMAGGLLTLGLPGVIILGIATPFIQIIWGVKDFGDSHWPLGAIISVFLPALIIPGYYISFYKISTAVVFQVLAFIATIIFGGVILSIITYAVLGGRI